MKGYVANVVARARFAPPGARPARQAFERIAESEAAQPAAPAPPPRAARAVAAREAATVRANTPEHPVFAPSEREVVRVVGRRAPAAVAAAPAPPPPSRSPADTPNVVAPRATPRPAAHARSGEAAPAPQGRTAPIAPPPPASTVAVRAESVPVRAHDRAPTPRVDERTLVDEHTVVIEREVEIAAASREIEQRTQRSDRSAQSPTIRVVVPPYARGFGGDVTAAIERGAREAARRRLAAQSGADRPLEVRIDRVDVHVPAAPVAAVAAAAPASASNVLARSLSRF